MSDVAGALHLLMARLAATEAQWQTEKAARERAEAERDEARGTVAGLDCEEGCGCGKRHCAVGEEAECVTCLLTRQRNEARGEVERLKADVERLRKEKGHLDDAWKAQHRAALESLRKRCADRAFAENENACSVCRGNVALRVRSTPLEVEP